MDKILVVFTGGTIGSRNNNGIIDVADGSGYELLQRYAESSRDNGLQFETLQPLHILSENVNPDHWRTLIDCLHKADISGYAGIIVTHGSDTLAFTSAMLGYVFCDIRIPLVVVAANYPLQDERSNGLRNFINAVDFIRDMEIPGVYAVYENDRSEAAVYLGTRLSEALPFTDQFDAPYAAPFGLMESGKFLPNQGGVSPDIEELRHVREAAFDRSCIRFSTEVMFVRPFPGLDYSFFDFRQRKPKAVLHGVYHSATANNLRAEAFQSSLGEFALYCKEHGVELYTAPAKSEGSDLYHTADALTKAGVVGLPQIGVEAALVKLMLAYGMFTGKKERDAFLGRSVFFEIHEGGRW